MVAEQTDAGPAPPIKAVPVRHPGRWVGVVVIVVLVAMLVHSFLTNPNFQWDVVGQYLFSEPVLRGLRNTLILTALSMVIGIVGGVLLAVMRLSPNPVLAGAAAVYVWLFRGTPLITQLIFWNFLAALYPRSGLGIPFGPTFVSVDTNAVISVFAASLLGLGLNEAAYMAEIVRGGIQSVDPGQSEAAGALGLSPHADAAADRAAAGDAGDRAAHRQRDDLDAQDDFARGRHRVLRADGRRADHLLPHVPDDPAAHRRGIWYLALTSVLSIGQSFIERRSWVGRARRGFAVTGRRRGA